ncbi:type II toxin-antitoxin system VapC family toxin [Pelagicoccus sp. SDUM812002]|uniref:type II toxin-antitoxin system VapC family toxin n=1 Tax=Pelagicoccus sp. SDUM812002 TaxID=3041266 RepID=UPI00280EF4BF|nr:type II toxin-antitoxin system VapC family toxin [Pelagicoccus sp. SDUM812002]MDQ8184086.1 type II toxin-antitoxin system VapC family toxin [Pelagicoccus sp. SDUM812002]
MRRYLLDTNMLLGFIRGAEWARETFARLDFAAEDCITFTSSISRGEILALAERNGWGPKKRNKLEAGLRQFSALGIDKESVSYAYAKITAWSQGKPIEPETFGLAPKPAKPMKQNDAWIAAIAYASNAILVTTDGDFDHLDGRIIEVETVDQRNS